MPPVISFPVVSFTDPPAASSKRRLADLPGRVVAGDPHHETQIMFQSPDGGTVVGRWVSTPGKWHTFADRDEYCYIISGHCRLIDKAGLTRDFRTGDSFLIPNGFVGYWDVIETTTKDFVIRDYTSN